MPTVYTISADHIRENRKKINDTMTVTLFATVLILTLASSVYGYPSFQQKIPNGNNVRNPCNRSDFWNGTGHQNVKGGGALNPFGNDFEANGNTWNEAICRKDSDGDGLSNGRELGDPDCVWTKGQTPTRTENVTHPGVCEPLDSTQCIENNSWMTKCNNTEFVCPAIKDPGVKNYTMRFPPTRVPTDETTYICHLFRLPNYSDADIIAIEPVLDNLEIMHHMILFGCSGDVSDTTSNEPFYCGMNGGYQCSSFIGLWSFGSSGQCLSSQLGFRIGPKGYQHAVVQIHWNNPMHKPNLTDSSGMRIYYTTQLRPNRGEIMMAGQQVLTIPPGKDSVSFSGNCTALCTRAKMSQSVYITSSTLHMHLLGKSGIIRLYRNGQFLQIIENVTTYDYNTPKMTEFATPIEMKPGDSIQVECVYSSTGKDETTYYGPGTNDEMCYGFFVYYPPIPGFTFCGQRESAPSCGEANTVRNCNLETFLENVFLLPTLCSANCSDINCTDAVSAALMTGCPRDDDVRAYLQEYMSPVSDVLAYCSLAQQPAGTACIPVEADQTHNHCSPSRSYSGTIPLLLAFVVYFRRLF